jgi:hypothetical protein
MPNCEQLLQTLSLRSLRALLSGFWAIALSLAVAAIAHANVAAPPAYAWFTFTDTASKPVFVQGVQLAECRTMTCEQAVLLLQTGTCSASGCLRSAPVLTSPLDRFECAENRCLYVEKVVSDRKTGPYFKLIAQVASGVRSSKGFRLSLKSPLESTVSENLRVTVSEAELAIAPDPRPSQPTRLDLFWLAFGLTQVTELAVTALLMWRLKVDQSSFIKLLVAIAFINLLTFPVVWFFFPSLQPFQYRSLRVVGALSLVEAIGFSVLLQWFAVS